jgi:hypothetical protein
MTPSTAGEKKIIISNKPSKKVPNHPWYFVEILVYVLE